VLLQPKASYFLFFKKIQSKYEENFKETLIRDLNDPSY
jgi:hypothetical protein